MQKYVNVRNIAAVLNVMLLVFFLYLLMDRGISDSHDLFISILGIVCPAFTLFTLFIPSKP